MQNRHGVISVFSMAATALAVVAFAFAGSSSEASQASCAPDNGGITLPHGFCATVFADQVGSPRHLTVAPNGDVFVALRRSRSDSASFGVLALRDTNGDGVADVRKRFGEGAGTGITLHGGYLYYGDDTSVMRYRLPEGSLEPTGSVETIVHDLPRPRNHPSKPIAINDSDQLFVTVGSPSNVCQGERAARSVGQDPCPELDNYAGIWLFDANGKNQTQADGQRFATGLRNTVALALNPVDGLLYGAVHGRDRLNQWSDLFTDEQNAELPSETLVRIDQGKDYGWPYCYHDPQLGRLVLAPEYGGDGRRAGRCAQMEEPLAALPAHWAPNGLLFYTGEQFPERYRGGAFIAFHGSWNRAPLPQGGYNVVFVPFVDGRPRGDYEVFADGFAGEDVSPGGAAHRPSGVAQGPDGSVYVTDDRSGRIWRIFYIGG
jgi:glucose/arabinose dehydrogenase